MLNEKGYYRPLYDEILEKKINLAKQMFGEDIDTTEQSVIGKYIRIESLSDSEIYEDLERIYYARYPNTAIGTSLERLCPFAGLSRNPPICAQHKVSLKGTANAIIPIGTLVKSDTNAVFYLMEDTTLSEEGTAEAIVICKEGGIIGNVTNISQVVESVENLNTVSYLETIVLGEEEETDYALRLRFQRTISGAGSGTANSIIGAVARVEGVSSVILVENNTMEVDSAGRPPKSFEVYVLAPKGQEYAIAEAIFSKKPVGIPCVGDIAVEVKDSGGNLHTVKFSRSQEISIYIKLIVRINHFFEKTGIEDIKANLVNYILGLENGQDVILSSLYGYIHQIVGVVEIIELSLSQDGVTYKKQNISCNAYEVARLLEEHIEIEVENYE